MDSLFFIALWPVFRWVAQRIRLVGLDTSLVFVRVGLVGSGSSSSAPSNWTLGIADIESIMTRWRARLVTQGIDGEVGEAIS